MSHETFRLELASVDGDTVLATALRLGAWDATAWDREVHLDDEGGARIRLVHEHLGRPFVACIDGGPDRTTTVTVEGTRTIDGGSWAREGVHALTARLGWHDDLARFWEAVAYDPALADVLHARGQRPLARLRLARHPTPFEALTWALVRQRTPHRFAVASLQRLKAALGDAIDAEGRRWTLTPTPHRMAADDARADILEATGNLRKTDRLHAVAAEFVALDEGLFAQGPIDEARRAASKLTGVGPWTADYLLLMGFGRLDHVPWSDTGLARAVSATYAGGLTLAPGDLRRLASHYPSSGGMWAHVIKRVHHGMRGY